MPTLERFLDPLTVSLKICGVKTLADANQLVELGVDALGVNFWPCSKRYLSPEDAVWLHALAGKILRVGVFVNEAPELPLRLVRDGLLDVVQLHGDEAPCDAAPYRDAAVPFIKAIGVKTKAVGFAGKAVEAHERLLVILRGDGFLDGIGLLEASGEVEREGNPEEVIG